MTVRRWGACLLLSGCVAAETNPAVDGKRAPTRLSGPPVEFPNPFSVIRAVMALPDGRLVVTDPQENRVSLIDFDKRTSRSLGQIGEGPKEYRRVTGLYRGQAGKILIFDHELRRLLEVLPSGALGDVISAPTGGIAGGWSPHGPDDLAFDSLGNTYNSHSSIGLFTDTTLRVMRHRPGGVPESVTRVLKPVTKAVRARRNGTGTYQEVLFSPQDTWTVAPDGWVAVARARPYRVEWISPAGATITGPTISHRLIRITQAEKELIASGTAGPRGRIEVSLVLVGPSGPPGSARSSAPEPIPVKDLLFAKVKPPIKLRDGVWPLIDEDGRLWVERTLTQDRASPVFDVFDRSGNLVQRVELPTGSRLVGFDSKWLYAARRDPDDFDHLQRFSLPR